MKKKIKFVAILLACVLSVSNILLPMNVYAEEFNVLESGKLIENTMEDNINKSEENTKEKENISEKELPVEENESKVPEEDSVEESVKQESQSQESDKPEQEIPQVEKSLVQELIKKEAAETQQEKNQNVPEEKEKEKSESYIRYRADGVKEIYLTEEEYEKMLQYDWEHLGEPEVYTDEISEIYFPEEGILLSVTPRASDLVYSGKVDYHGYKVGKFKVGNKDAFCIQHSKYNPPSGTSYTTSTWNNEIAKKILYYGYKGQKPWSGFESDIHGRVLTSMALSYLIEGKSEGSSYLWSDSGGKLQKFYDYCKGAPLPNTSLSFSKTNVTAYVNGNEQRTENIKLNAGDASNSVTISVPSGITLHNVSTGAKVTNGKATIKGGQSFYISASLSRTGSWKTGTLTGSLKTVTSVTRVNSSGNNQDLAYANFNVDSGKKVELTVNFLSKGELELIKTSANPEITDGSSCYSFEGAEFGVYSDANTTTQVGKLITDENGKSNTLSLNAGTYWIKELKAPKGYALSSEVKKIQVTPGQKTTVTFADLPQMDPVGVLLGKIDRETNLNKKETDGYHVINRDSVGGNDHTGGTAPNNAVEMVTDKNGDSACHS